MCTRDYIIDFYCIAINIGFEQERYTVFEATDANGQLIPIPIVKENGQESELTFVIIAILTLGSGPTAAQPNEDFIAAPRVQRLNFDADQQVIYYRFELWDDFYPEPTETFHIQLFLANEGFTNINLGASGFNLFAAATVVIIDDDGKRLCVYIIFLPWVSGCRGFVP